MSEAHRRWEAICLLREQSDIANIGCTVPREPMPIGMLFEELDRSMAARWAYRPLSSPFGVPAQMNVKKDRTGQ